MKGCSLREARGAREYLAFLLGDVDDVDEDDVHEDGDIDGK